MLITKYHNKNSAILHIEGNVETIKNCFGILTNANELIKCDNISTLVLDLLASELICGSFCGFIATILKKSQENNKKFVVLVKKNSPNYELFHVTGFDAVLDIHTDDKLLKAHT